ncbi:MAG: hypothetical protein MJ250_02185 [Alphaproteobacteria bacterium]|nr:hypothetical protein [Alphaproteobacteria bacterium]
MANKFYYLKIFWLQNRLYFLLGFCFCLFIVSGILYFNRPRIPVTEQEFEEAVLQGEELYNEKKYEDAFEYLYYPASQGYAKAKFLIGEMYYSGLGTEKDVQKAYQNYKESAEQIIDSKYKMATLAFRGEIKELPKGEATTILTQTAYAGFKQAQRDLGLYSYMSNDFEQAYFWLSLANNDEEKMDADMLEKVRLKLSDYQLSLLDAEIKDFVK